MITLIYLDKIAVLRNQRTIRHNLVLNTMFRRNMSLDLRGMIRGTAKEQFAEAVFVSNKDKLDAWLEFISLAAGKIVTYIDDTAISRQVRLIKVTEISYDGRNNTAFSLEMEKI